MRRFCILAAATLLPFLPFRLSGQGSAEPRAAGAQSRMAGWTADIDSLSRRIDESHPNPWRFRARSAFVAEAAALRDSARTLSDARMLTGIMRLVASIHDGHTGVIDLGIAAGDTWFPVRFALFDDGLWVTSITSQHSGAAGKRVRRIGAVDADEVVRRMLAIAHGDNEFNRRQHSAMLSNGSVAMALGLTAAPDTLCFETELGDGRTEAITVRAAKGRGSIAWEQYGEMEAPPPLPVTTAFRRTTSQLLDPANNADLPLHLRGRRAYWWTYEPASRMLYFQLNAVAAKSRHSDATLLESWTRALSLAGSVQPVDRFVLDLRYNSGGDGSLIPRMIKALAQRDTSLARPGRFFVVTSGKTFSAAADLVGQLTKYFEPMLVGEPPGAGLNASGDAGSISLSYSGIVVSVSTHYTQSVRPRLPSATVIPINLPAPMRGEDYFAGRDPSMEAITSQPAPCGGVLHTLREKGGAEATALWRSLNARYRLIQWWQPWRWQDLNSLSYELLEAGRTDDAIAGFIINTERNPQLWETWDSLGEAYLKAGRKAEALSNYQQALRIDPRNWNAAEQQRIVNLLRATKSP